MYADDRAIIKWITYNGRRIPIKKSMTSKFEKKMQDALNQKQEEEKTKAGQDYREKLTKISKPTIPDGTYDLDTGKPVDFGGKGYNVSFEQSGVKLSDAEYWERIQECRNKCDGRVYAGKFGGDPEISFYTTNKEDALEIMRKYNQHSVWDNSIGDIIENPDYDEKLNKVNYVAKDDLYVPKRAFESYYEKFKEHRDRDTWTGAEYTNDEFMEHLTDANWHSERKMLEDAGLTNSELEYIKNKTKLQKWGVGEELTGKENVNKMILEAKKNTSKTNMSNYLQEQGYSKKDSDFVVDTIRNMGSKNNNIVNDDKKGFVYSFRVGDRNIFEVRYNRTGNNKNMDFATSSSELNKLRTDITRGGQAQKDLLKTGTTARNFYDKWDKKHLNALTESEYDDLIKDIEKLKEKYPYIDNDRFWEQAQLDKKTKIVKTKSLSEIEQYFLSLGYSKPTALKMAKQYVAERKRK